MILFGAYYDEETKVLHGTHESGFYSCINTVRASLYELITNKIFPNSITLSKTLNWYKDNTSQDYYSILYKTDLKDLDKIKGFNQCRFCPTAIKFNDIDFKNTKIIESAYFSPSKRVENNTARLIKKYNIDNEKTLSILHRGNDKWKEARLIDIHSWIQEIEKNYDGGRILIQTDEKTFKDGFLEHFKDKCFFFEEMIFNDSYVVPENNKETWAVNFESIMRIISESKKIITHSGNCGFVPVIYRGNVKNVTHLYNDGVFVTY
jgi:hypothetical protein